VNQVLKRIIVVDDDDDLRGFLVSSLESSSFVVKGLSSGHSLLSELKDFAPDVLLLDVHLPEVHGSEIIKGIRGYHLTQNIPIIMMSGDGETNMKVKTLGLGADDYIVKPFSEEELVARILALIRRSGSSKESTLLTAEDLQVDLDSHKVIYRGEEQSLTLTEYRILCELLKNRGRVLSRDDLRRSALNNLGVSDRTIDVHMTSLRKKIDLCARFVKTVRGVGYLFIKSEV